MQVIAVIGLNGQKIRELVSISADLMITATLRPHFAAFLFNEYLINVNRRISFVQIQITITSYRCKIARINLSGKLK